MDLTVQLNHLSCNKMNYFNSSDFEQSPATFQPIDDYRLFCTHNIRVKPKCFTVTDRSSSKVDRLEYKQTIAKLLSTAIGDNSDEIIVTPPCTSPDFSQSDEHQRDSTLGAFQKVHGRPVNRKERSAKTVVLHNRKAVCTESYNHSPPSPPNLNVLSTPMVSYKMLSIVQSSESPSRSETSKYEPKVGQNPCHIQYIGDDIFNDSDRIMNKNLFLYDFDEDEEYESELCEQYNPHSSGLTATASFKLKMKRSSPFLFMG